MNKKPKFLIGGKFTAPRPVTADELRHVMGQSGAKIDPFGNGTNIVGGLSPYDATTKS